MFTYNQINLTSIDELHQGFNLHHRIEDQLNKRKRFNQLRIDVDLITQSLELPTLTDQQLEEGIITHNKRDGDGCWQVQYERIDILEGLAHQNKRDNNLTITDLQLVLNSIIVGSIYLITEDNLIVGGTKALFFREVITLPAYRIVSYYHHIPGVFRLLLNQMIEIGQDLGVGVLISDPFEHVTDLLIDKFEFHLNCDDRIKLTIPGIGTVTYYDVHRFI